MSSLNLKIFNTPDEIINGAKAVLEVKNIPQLLSIVNAKHPRLTLIIGRTGSGKSALALTLKNKITDSVFIDAGACSQYQAGILDVTNERVSNETLYILDGLHYLSPESITTLTLHIKKGGRVVLFADNVVDALFLSNYKANYCVLGRAKRS